MKNFLNWPTPSVVSQCFILNSFGLILAIFFSSCNSGSNSQNANEPVYVIETSMGNIEVKLYEKTPFHRDNFEKLVAEHYYDSIQFHRVIKDFMIQAGDGSTKKLAPGEHVLGQADLNYTIPAEIVYSYYHKKGALAAARMGDQVNPEKRSSPSQFYIVQGRTYNESELNDIDNQHLVKYSQVERDVYKNIGGTPFLDQNYTVFGEVTKGLDVVDKIATVPTEPGDWPVDEVYILRIKKK
ncbi:MAG: peptidylprolyl isomerase [Dysgonamonadaceae bacterium]|nr:peptidylprolyl isomerase [Dysgonamonadaceae bacterium]